MRKSDEVEIEARFINLDRANVENKLRKLGATKVSEKFFKEWIFARPEWSEKSRRVRVRTDGEYTWLTYKANATWEVDSTEEVEVGVLSAEGAAKLISKLDVPLLRYQEKKRIQYHLRDIVFELDFWPKIPMVLEIEAPTKEKVQEGAVMLGLDWKDAIFVDQKVLHREYYGIDLDKVSEYKF